MGYYDGNTVSAYCNYAQRYAMSDNSYDTNFGPSTDGAINLISGQTNGVSEDVNAGGSTIGDGNGRVNAKTVTRIIVPFVGYSGRYVWHCHILEHEDNEMMRPYEVLPAGS